MRLRDGLALAAAGVVVAMAGLAPAAHASAPGACPSTMHRLVPVDSSAGLTKALLSARPGDQIRLADAVYRGHFTLTKPGTSYAPIVICGTSEAVLDGGSTRSGYVLHLVGATWSTVSGVTVEFGAKGVMIDGSAHVTLSSVTVHTIGQEGVHIRRNSTETTIVGSHIYGTGLVSPAYGEGVYVGSAQQNWCAETSCQPDHSDDAVIEDNVIGPDVSAEEIDVKEGTSSGQIIGNTFDGTGMSNAQSWVDVKGNKWIVNKNVGQHSRVNGFTDTVAVVGWGDNNHFADNHAVVDASGYGFKVADGSMGVVVYTSNVVSEAGAGAANVRERK